MSEPIVSIAEIERRARRAVDDGEPITACPFPPLSAAAKTWCVAYQARVAELTSEATA